MIPKITEPLGKYWEQPDPSTILLDTTHALMTEANFKDLHEYSSTIPTGVYPGKMWKRYDGVHDPRCKREDRQWLLMWYDEIPNQPDRCSINHRKILLLNGSFPPDIKFIDPPYK